MGALGNLIPLVVLFVVVAGLAYIGYQMYLFANELSERGKTHMQKKNIVFGKDGMKVGVKEVKNEDYEDKTQSYLVKMWSHTSFPAYKSKLWNTMAPDAKENGSTEKRPSASRSSSSSKIKSK